MIAFPWKADRMTIYKCADCGNLHGARVDSCGMCGSLKVAASEEAPPSAPPSAPPDFDLGPLVGRLVEALIELADAGTTFILASMPPDEEEDEEEDEEAEEPPGASVGS